MRRWFNRSRLKQELQCCHHVIRGSFPDPVRSCSRESGSDMIILAIVFTHADRYCRKTVPGLRTFEHLDETSSHFVTSSATPELALAWVCGHSPTICFASFYRYRSYRRGVGRDQLAGASPTCMLSSYRHGPLNDRKQQAVHGFVLKDIRRITDNSAHDDEQFNRSGK